MDARGTQNFKVVLLGEGRVGKTSTVLRYVQDKFDDKMQATIQASFLKKVLAINQTSINMAIWDTAGQERFHSLGPIYYRDADGAVLVYDVTDGESFEKVKTWVKELRKMVGKNICLSIVGNKCDRERERQVSAEEGASYAESVGAVYHNTSAKLNRGIEETFFDLAKRMLDARQSGQGQAGSRYQPPFQRQGTANLTISNQPTQQKKGCCGS
eukprot:TRINITY_DN3580_c0_g1_i1.p1 TRINITY_DN3580_c0_g1~~TRINITY_DN3580_c0_g1_i1.p1  ORF type:complete len:213 (-),score=55.97 TRINITY_DN3580_c0_g1_i1:193-831(-)